MKVLIIGDLHAPFNHVNYLKFCKDLRDQHQPDKVVFIGDVVDQHALARFTPNPEGMSPGDEWVKTVKELKKWYSAFPEAIWIMGNHDRRPFNKAFEAGIPRGMMKPMQEIYRAPKGWELVESINLDEVLYIHGEGVGGLNSALNSCLRYGQSTVFGHMHSIGGVRYHQQPGKQLFSLGVGCGIDDTAYAFAYGKHFPVRSMLGAGIVDDGTYAQFIPMDLGDRRYRRKRRVI